jgi:hypothetical protein
MSQPASGASIWSANQLPSSPSTASATAQPAQPAPEVAAIMSSLAAAMPAGHFRPADEPVLATFARALLIERRLGEKLLHQAFMTTAAERAAYREAIRAIDSLSSRLQLNPQSRGPRRPGRPRK